MVSNFRWLCIYPIYLDKDRTAEQGRKISKELAISKPDIKELALATSKLGFQCIIEVP